MFFKKSVKKATKKFRSLRADLTQVIRQEVQVQKVIRKELVHLEVRQQNSADEMEEAQAILLNVNTFLGKKHSS